MGNRLEGAVALVTGASSGIGEATARALAIGVDLADPEQAVEAVNRTASELGRLDLLVNNAGQMLLGPIEGAPTEEWDRMIDLNLKALIATAHAAVPHLLAAAEDSERNCADLVNVSSVAGRIARRGSAVYNLTKHGVGAFSESFRQEFGGRRVRSIVIEPGAVATELTDHIREEVRERVRARFTGIEILEAADVADAIVYAVTRPWHVSINELLIRPTEQEG